ncbi:hypothetical protein C4573_06945 [Candidatus Woesearchaeota archaeon]|nr:MAG: hypothetical protein C4573_06945 [Candidatus Woesearchaeota archaeon]
MNILPVIILFLAIFVIIILMKLVKNVLKVILYVVFLTGLVLLVTGFLVVTDAKNFKNNMQNSSNTFILVKDKTVMAGMVVDRSQLQQATYLSKETINTFQEYYQNRSLDKLKGKTYKLFILNWSLMDDVKTNLSLQGFTLSSADVQKILQSNNAIHDAASLISQRYHAPEIQNAVKIQLTADFKTDQQLKDAVFALYFNELFTGKALNMVKSIKNEEIVVYPETALFSAIHFVPSGWINDALEVRNESQILEKKG